ncbi:hypothetical protein CRUP_016745 [Coryphaenoides rupestris]|nr:hypothetical protein CRUP_016745 [Coryphaenoides rupestris]
MCLVGWGGHFGTAVLTLYFVQYLHWDKDLSTAVYHAFNSLCYFTPVLGALIADSWLAEKLVQQKMEAIQEKVHLGQPVEGEYLTHLLLSDQMNLEEILASITELLVAGVDTVGYRKDLSPVKMAALQSYRRE